MNAINWFEIPAAKLERAVKFYEQILAAKLPIDTSFPGMPMAMLPYEEPGVGAIGHTTPSRLRLASRWTEALWRDRFLGYALEYDAREHLITMRRLARRGTRTVRTGELMTSAIGRVTKVLVAVTMQHRSPASL